MIPDEKKEEIRETADIVEVVEDYVKLKRSGRSYKGLCPFHDENTPSFHVTPDLGIYKCFGCGESGDVFNFVMEMEGIGFVEAMRTLAQRFGVSLPEEDDPEFDEEHNLREGIYHALRYAGVYYYRQLIESNEAEQARQYLQERGYNREIMQKFGLGYAPREGEKLYKAAVDSGLNEEYLSEAGLIKPSKRGEGYYDTFRGRLMFPIFNPSGKVIAFAGRVLGNEKTAKYINSPQTKVYNKSEVLYGVNFAKGGIRKSGDVLLVEGYTDVITLNQNNIDNVVASSGTSLTPGQMHLLHRYGDAITMIYDSDSAGQRAMKRGINIGLAEGMDVKLLELPQGEDPDSFVRQFGEDSFRELKEENSEDFLHYLVHKAQEDGSWDEEKEKVITLILESIAHIPDKIKREVKVQKLNEISKIGDRALFEELGKILKELKKQKERARKRKKREREREQKRQREEQQQAPVPHQPDGHTRAFEQQVENSKPQRRAKPKTPPGKKPNYEKELIRLMLMYDRTMIDYIGSLCNEQQFENEQLKTFYLDIIERYKEEKEVSVQVYADREHPYPQLVGEIVLEEHSVSERHPEKTGVRYKRDKNPYMTAKGALKALKVHYLESLQRELQQKYDQCETTEERKKVMRTMKEVGRQRTLLQKTPPDELFPDPESDEGESLTKKVFEYKMKGEE
ncbi:DNA primase [Aliifodinibius sp. S!AR15-10]|uniref:DNA primase n=1 Tax=Aliifodinibius sp. S!AR15-10 TaxID=2950437 RepID=UPI00285B8106|nr:DNA primase [Aliifodinibius sp. S!AR15-10]MDR8390121.1 DNA primase [Aliifodinibius sp. S!AR15-10]